MLLTEHDIYLFREGTHSRAYEKLGVHVLPPGAGHEAGTHFAVWAPHAASVSVIGDFNGWNPATYRLAPRHDSSGIWEALIPGIGLGTLYKYHIVSRHGGYTVQKTDPYAFHCEKPPRTASVVWDLAYDWEDGEWLGSRARANALDAPWSIYELHLGSFRCMSEEHDRWLNYRELAHAVADYATEMGFTHIALMPVMEHPLLRLLRLPGDRLFRTDLPLRHA